ncbi:MAG: TatD family hydrolase [Clostridia bacterium]|nr:TatD family hydrolase [Clostridia bacterium]
MPLFDSHAHYDDDKFNDNREEIIKGLCQKSDTNPLGISAVLNSASDIKSSYAALELTKRYPFFYCSCGIHPHEAEDAEENFEDILTELLKNEKVRAIGEIGLDYHYDFSPRDVQKEIFRRQMSLAEELSRPVIIHDREAHGDCMEIVRDYKVKGVFHSFSGSAEMVKELVRLGYYISFSGVVTFKNASSILKAVEAVPDDRLLVETDCPYLAPVPYRGQVNNSSFMYETAKKLAEVRGVSVEEIAILTASNACELFGINSQKIQ